MVMFVLIVSDSRGMVATLTSHTHVHTHTHTHTVERVSDVPSEQRTLFQGYTFMLTLKPKDDVKSSQCELSDELLEEEC